VIGGVVKGEASENRRLVRTGDVGRPRRFRRVDHIVHQKCASKKCIKKVQFDQQLGFEPNILAALGACGRIGA
jgi:hypothetical protein